MAGSAEQWVVLVSYFFPPMNAVGGLRLAGFARRIHKLSGGRFRCLVITVGGDYVLEATDDFHVLRCPDWRVGFHLITARPTVSTSGDGRPPWHRRVLRRVAREVLLPDDQGLWLLQSRKVEAVVRRLIGTSSVCAVLGSTPPATNMFLACYLARRLNASLILDYRDSWTLNPYNENSRFRRALDRLAERSLLRRAAALVCAGPSCVQEHAKHDPKLILTGYDEPSLTRIGPVAQRGPFVLLYAGQLYEGRRDPAGLIETVRVLSERHRLTPSELRAVFLGDSARTAERLATTVGMADFVSSTPAVDADAAFAVMCASGALVSISWDSEAEEGAVPGKLFEYMRTGRPILAYGGSASTVGTLLAQSGAGTHASTPLQAAEFIQPYLMSWLVDPVPIGVCVSGEYSKDSSVRTLLQMIDSLG